MQTQFFMPYMRLLGFPLVPLEEIKVAGFDGVEIHLAGFRHTERVAWRPLYNTICTAIALDLKVTLHQAWSLEENATHFHNYVLDFLGYLPKSGYRLVNHIPAAVPCCTVIYADRWREAIGRPYWLQTCSVFGKNGQYKISYTEFLNAVRGENLSVVFDTQHYLEHSLNVPGVEKLPTDRGELLNFLKQGWDELRTHVREIHLVDCNPLLGHSKGRNVFPGEGIMPLAEFIQYVKSTGWTGNVTPEVSSFTLRGAKLIRLRKKVAELFR